MRLKELFVSLMMFMAAISTIQAQEKVVTLDYFFNHETKKNKEGKEVRFHYTWEDKTLNGYSNLGDLFKKAGFQTKSLDAGPTAANLKGTDVYIIVDPDNTKESPAPNFITANYVENIAKWVKAGGILVLLGNDSANTNLEQLNHLSEKFGIKFSSKSRNMVKGNDFKTGAVHIPAGNEVFKTAKMLYVKELAPLELSAPATALISEQNDVIIATAKYGKGIVFALGDPWIYNEYIDGTRTPAIYENPKGAADLVNWLNSKVTK